MNRKKKMLLLRAAALLVLGAVVSVMATDHTMRVLGFGLASLFAIAQVSRMPGERTDEEDEDQEAETFHARAGRAGEE